MALGGDFREIPEMLICDVLNILQILPNTYKAPFVKQKNSPVPEKYRFFGFLKVAPDK